MKKINFEFGAFIKNTKKSVYDRIENESFPFFFLKFSEPKRDYLVNNGVEVVVQSWSKTDKLNKTLHSGLIPLGNGFSFGNNLNDKGGKDFILLRLLPATRKRRKKHILFWIVRNKNPRNKTKFANELISYLNSIGKLDF